jgi:hypothetical protein
MTEMEVYDASVKEVTRWFHANSNILNICDVKDGTQKDIYGDTRVCTYFVAMTQMFSECIDRGWNPDQMIQALKNMSEELEKEQGMEIHFVPEETKTLM